MNIDIIDVGLAAALLVVLGHNLRLSRKIDRLFGALKEALPLIENFSEDVDRAEVSVARFKSAQEAKSRPEPAPVTPARRNRGMSLIDQFYAVAGMKEKT
mgnify:FL=1